MLAPRKATENATDPRGGATRPAHACGTLPWSPWMPRRQVFTNTPERSRVLHIFVDADACPVKQEIYRVASRHGLQVTLVSNTWMRVPYEPWITLEVVDSGLDAADDWIAEHAQPLDIVVTADIPLADRCLKAGAQVLGTTGKPFTEDSIGQALATRDLLADLRDAGEIHGGPPPQGKGDRSRFLQKLDEMIHAIRRQHPPRPG